MSSGQTDIVNQALGLLGESPIADLTEGSAVSIAASRQYDAVRRMLLRKYNWTFALRRKRLVEMANATPGVYSHTYALPEDCLRPIRIIGADDRTPPDESPVTGFEPVGDRRISCDDPDPLLEYVANITDTTIFDDLFTEALAYHLAAALAMPITGDGSKWQAMKQAARQFTSEAAAQSGRERRDPGTVNPYVDARV